MFQDFGELDGVFYQLDEDSRSNHRNRLAWICESDSEFNRRLEEIMKAVMAAEVAAGMTPGASYQSGLLANLWECLGYCSTPAKLRTRLHDLKKMLLQAMVIEKEIDARRLFVQVADLSSMAEKGRKFTGNKRGLDALGRVIIDILQKLGSRDSAKEVWRKLEELAAVRGHPVIVEIDEDTIVWKDDNGQEKTTQFDSLKNRLPRYRYRIENQ